MMIVFRTEQDNRQSRKYLLRFSVDYGVIIFLKPFLGTKRNSVFRLRLILVIEERKKKRGLGCRETRIKYGKRKEKKKFIGRWSNSTTTHVSRQEKLKIDGRTSYPWPTSAFRNDCTPHWTRRKESKKTFRLPVLVWNRQNTFLVRLNSGGRDVMCQLQRSIVYTLIPPYMMFSEPNSYFD